MLHISKARFTRTSTFASIVWCHTMLLKRFTTKLFEASLRWNSVDIANVRIGYWMCWSLIRPLDNAFGEKILRGRDTGTFCVEISMLLVLIDCKVVLCCLWNSLFVYLWNGICARNIKIWRKYNFGLTLNLYYFRERTISKRRSQ